MVSQSRQLMHINFVLLMNSKLNKLTQDSTAFGHINEVHEESADVDYHLLVVQADILHPRHGCDRCW